MKLHCFIVFVTLQTEAVLVDLDVEGEVHFDLLIPRDLIPSKSSAEGSNGTGNSVEHKALIKMEHPRSQITAGPMVECMYQYPEQTQVNALLSNMMNELTKVFVRAQDMMSEDLRRKGTRFRVVHQKYTGFFENIYSNMSVDYLKFYNNASGIRVDRAGRNRDPCQHQDEVKQLWKELLDNSLTTFRRAAFQCIEEHLKVQNRSTDAETRGRMGQFLIRELSKVRAGQLNLLCDNFQLCFNELL